MSTEQKVDLLIHMLFAFYSQFKKHLPKPLAEEMDKGFQRLGKNT